MWQDNYKKTLVRNIILAVVIVLILAALALAMLTVHRETKAQDAQLVEVYGQQQKEQTEARREAVDAIEAQYEADLNTIAEYMPGIVCWGDNLTAGSSGNVSYPDVLQKYINAYICDIYDFRSTIENASDYSRLKWDDYKISIPVVNMGAGEEDVNTILGRSGVVPYIVSSEFTIPADTQSVEINFTSQNGKAVTPLTDGGAGVNNVSIDGIEGVLSIDPDSYKRLNLNRYYFTRCEAGEEKTVAVGTPIKTAASDEYLDYIHVICIGTYGGYSSTDELVQLTKELASRQTANKDRYIVIGLCSSNGFWNYGSAVNLDVVDTAMSQAFGEHYINVRKYLCTDGLSDAGITPTDNDVSNMQRGIVPESLRSPRGDAELSGKAYMLIGKLVYDRMEKLGYFDEIKKELCIEETKKQLLKDDPDYFTRTFNALNTGNLYG